MKVSNTNNSTIITFLIFSLAAMVTNSYGLSFHPWVSYLAGDGPIAIAAGDFNKDGKLDFAVANSGNDTISIRPGAGDGTFGTAVDYAVGSYPFAMTTGDFNNDGKPDLVVANASSSNVSVLLGNGDGTFAAAVNYGVGGSPYSITTGDVNRDGKADLAAACFNGNGVFVLLGIGDGTFAAAVNYSTGGSPEEVAVADFNKDGNPDLVVAKTNSNDLSVLLGKGDGTFNSAVAYTVGAYQNAVNAGDINGDGKPDIAVANGNNQLSIFLGNGDGTFQSPTHYTVGDRPEAVAIADFDGDGKIDVATANMNSHDVSILLGNGDGAFQSALNQSLGSNIYASSIALGDFDGNGALDLVIGSDGQNSVAVLLNSTTIQPRISPQTGTIGTEIEFTDANLGNKKGVVSLRAESKTYKLKIISWNENGSGVTRAVLNKVLPPGLYDVIIQPKEPKDTPPIIETGTFTVAGPDIQEISSSSGTEGDIVTVTGVLFGTKKPKVYLEYTAGTTLKRKSCKVSSWPLTSESGTLSGEITITIPKGIPEGQWSLAVENGVGLDTVDFEYTEER